MGTPSVHIAVNADISGLRGQFAQAGAASKEAAAQMTRAGAQAEDAWQRLAAATINANEAHQVVRSTLKALATGEVPTCTRVTDDLAIAQREAAVAAQQLAASQRAIKTAMTESSVGMASGYQQATLLSNVMGLRLGRGMEQIISRTPILAAGMGAIFPVITAIAFAEVAAKIGEAIAKWISDTMIFTKEMQEAYAAELTLNKQLSDQYEDQKRAQRQLFEDTHSQSQVKQTDLAAEKKNVEDLTAKLQANQSALNALYGKARSEMAAPAINPVSGKADGASGEISPETQAQINKLGGEATLLNVQLSRAKTNVQEIGIAYRQAGDQEKAQSDAAKEAAQRALEERASLQVKLKDAGLGNVVNSMPGGDVTAHAKVDLSHIAEIVRKAHEDLSKSVDEAEEKLTKASDADVKQFIADIEEAKKRAQELREEQDIQAQGARDKGLGNVSFQEQQVKGQAASGQINPQQELQAMISLHEQQLAIERAYIAAKLEIDKEDPKAYLKDLNEQQKAEQKGAMQRLQDEQAQLALSEQAYKQWAQQVTSTMFNGVNSWLAHQKNFGQAMKQEWNSLAMDTIKVFEQMGEKWVLQHVLMRAASLLFHTTDLAQHTATAAAKEGIDTAQVTANQATLTARAAATSLANVAAASSYAAVAAAAALASTAAIPVVGPALAPGVAAAMLGTGMGFAALAAFDLGGVVPKTQVALVHGGERVLTGKQNTVFERMISQSTNTRGGGGDTHYHDNRKISALDGVSTARVMRRSSKQVAKEFARAVRLGKAGGITG